jgi:hypothetical protein
MVSKRLLRPYNTNLVHLEEEEKMNTKYIKLISAVLVLALSSLACGVGSSGTPATSVAIEEVNQWAASASASSEFGVTGWIATQATGAPDTTECGDNSTAWASSSTDMVEWLQLGYTTPVYATQVVIHITYNPSYVTTVELIEPNGSTHPVYTAQPKQMACPANLTVSFPKTTYLVSGVKITIDQTTLDDWSEIDAVQLIGTLK